MIDFSLLQLDLTTQLSLIKRKALSIEELHQQQQRLTHIVNPIINAYISRDNNISFSQHGELAGISVAVKDNIDVKGFTTTAGLKVRQHVKAQNDAFVVSKLRQAGASFSGKLNMHEGALGASNENSFFGNCFNPYQTNLTPGGSSGGSGAAVAACMTSLALGSDTMGSVRIPASYCGVFGYKPSRGAISNRGSVACSRLMDSIGPITRSAKDLLLAANILLGYDANDAQSKVFSLTDSLPEKPILLIPNDLALLGVEADVLADFEHNINVFKAMGCQLKTINLSDYDFGAARRAGLILCEAEMRIEHQHAWQHQRSDFSEYLSKLLAYIDRKSPMDVISSERVLDHAVIKARSIFEAGHFMLMPTTPQRAFSFNEPAPANQADLTSLANQAGLPAVSLPMLTDNKLPIGMQLVAPTGGDLQLLALAEKWQKTSEFCFTMPDTIKDIVNADSSVL